MTNEHCDSLCDVIVRPIIYNEMMWDFFNNTLSTAKPKPHANSSVVRGGGGGVIASPHWHVDQNANQKNTRFLALLRPLNVLGLNSDLKHLLKRIFRRGLIC